MNVLSPLRKEDIDQINVFNIFNLGQRSMSWHGNIQKNYHETNVTNMKYECYQGNALADFLSGRGDDDPPLRIHVRVMGSDNIFRIILYHFNNTFMLFTRIYCLC